MNFVRTKIPSHQALEVQHKLTFVWIRKKERKGKRKKGWLLANLFFLNVAFLSGTLWSNAISNFTWERKKNHVILNFCYIFPFLNPTNSLKELSDCYVKKKSFRMNSSKESLFHARLLCKMVLFYPWMEWLASNYLCTFIHDEDGGL